ncbi:CHAT domain-containing protein [Streptomyces monashensis]|uniref:CHAT domain-containing protein n=1 Tax=Streptomyces monashensis TaxID=1678012 RepID=A0A1S2PTI0_9ACTN|nr:CHAT domain-containing protein [Streptomyces monashensis]OIJ97073.1 CHAT domain-containing protein [Streptomyces monashensis]
MSNEEDGGVRGLRTWAADAVARAKRLTAGLTPGAEPQQGGPVPRREYDASVAELDQMSGLFDHDPCLRSAVGVWLGGALAMRHLAWGGEPADRERAETLLRDARDPASVLGATVTEEDRRWAALFLLSLVSPLPPQQGLAGGAPDLSDFVAWASETGPAGMTRVAPEIRALTDEVVRLPLPPEFLAQLRRMQDFSADPTGPGLSDLLTGMMPVGPVTDRLRETTDRVVGMTGTAPAGGTAKPADSEPPGAPDPVLTPDGIRRIAAALDAVHATRHGLDEALRSEDPHRALNELLHRLRSVQDQPPPGPNAVSALEALRALLLNISQGAGGTHQDRTAGRAHMKTVLDHLENLTGSLPPGVREGDPAVMGRAMELYGRAMDAREAQDVRQLRELVEEAEALEQAVPENHPFRFMAVGALGAAYAGLGAVTRDRETLLRAVSYMESGMSGARNSTLPFAGEVTRPYLPDLGLLRAGLVGDGTATAPEDLAPLVPPPPGASTEELHTSALSLSMRYAVTHHRADLDALIAEQERVRDGVREGRAPRIAAEALWQLAQAYRERGVLDQDVKDIRALAAAKEALSALAADVLLQSGAEHGLLAARAGASRGVQAALWAASQGRLHEAVAALELGRALVLHAASTSSAVPELLRAAGHHDLAEVWRTAAGASRAGGADGEGGVPGELPSTLRRQALEALGYRREGGLLGTPSLSELADGVAESGADALIYLVPCEAGEAGVVIAVGPRIGAGVGVRSLLSGAESGPLERYLDATAAREAARREHRSDLAAEQVWEEALGALCDWAFEVLGPVLAGLEERLTGEAEAERDWDDRPLRLVLVPCGRLGIVPWHAARFPAGTPYDHLCQTAVISYAASGSQFLATLGRAPRDPVAAPVLLADPGMELPYSEIEVMALRDAFYRQARMCGGISQLPDEERAAAGTPDDVLSFLADGASMLHIASHGSAGTRPTVSALHLEGDLTVTRLLDGPDARRGAEDGPLVVLSACQTDLSNRDHDEALTLTTAFVAAGARDVVGSRWLAQDGASALLMAVFHHYVNVDGLSPVDALRAAQLWMLDPKRENPGSLHGQLLRQIRRPGLERVALWAPFIHQGHPGRTRTETQQATATTEKTETEGRKA